MIGKTIYLPLQGGHKGGMMYFHKISPNFNLSLVSYHKIRNQGQIKIKKYNEKSFNNSYQTIQALISILGRCFENKSPTFRIF